MINKQIKLNLFTKVVFLSLGAILIIALDQITKFWASSNLIDIGWFKIVEHNNFGVLFGINLPFILIIILSVLFLMILLWLFFSSKISNFIYYLGIALSFSGGMSNLIDRIKFGFVKDFLSISFWPIFNLADVAIIVGVMLIIYVIFVNEYAKK